jgi:hypothetical protein
MPRNLGFKVGIPLCGNGPRGKDATIPLETDAQSELLVIRRELSERWRDLTLDLNQAR